MEISQLEPRAVFRFFEEISQIPRPSYQERAISDYLAAFAERRGLFCQQDALGNIIIIKDASAGYEEEPPIILQGHMDMVCEKEPDCVKDMETEGLDLFVEGDFVKARGTTLGGDDGIAVAYAQAILDAEDIPHPRLEFVCTVCEEVGMEGATALDVSCLKGRRLLNLDSEEEGSFLAGCAGGCTAQITLPAEILAVEGENVGSVGGVDDKEAGSLVTLEISGLAGGHSGTEIDKGHANANRLMVELLQELFACQPFELVYLEGGSKDNAIPRSCTCILETDRGEALAKLAERQAAVIRERWIAAEPQICFSVTVQPAEGTDACRTNDRHSRVEERATGKLLQALATFPNGVIAMCSEPEGLVETSLNLGVMQLLPEGLTLRYSVRSCVDRELEALIGRLGTLAKNAGGTLEISGKYPAWEYRKHSPFREKLTAIYREMFGVTPPVDIIHAGLECGILAAKLPGLECVSMGPDILDIHTPKERMCISSVQRMYRYLLRVLKEREQSCPTEETQAN